MIFPLWSLVKPEVQQVPDLPALPHSLPTSGVSLMSSWPAWDPRDGWPRTHRASAESERSLPHCMGRIAPPWAHCRFNSIMAVSASLYPPLFPVYTDYAQSEGKSQSANRILTSTLFFCIIIWSCRYGGIGRRSGLKILWPVMVVSVRPRLPALEDGSRDPSSSVIKWRCTQVAEGGALEMR